MGFVPLMAVVFFLAYFLRPDFYAWLETKEGPVEYATVVVLIPGIVAGWFAFKHRRSIAGRWIGPWMILGALALFYFAGEELSWGQHILKWDSPDLFKQVNRQEETNLHNMSSLLGRKPKHLIEIWAIVCCIVVPLIRDRQGRLVEPKSDWGYWFWPTKACLLSAVLATVVYLPDRIGKLTGTRDNLPLQFTSELQEYYLALTLSLFMLSIWYRLRQMPT